MLINFFKFDRNIIFFFIFIRSIVSIDWSEEKETYENGESLINIDLRQCFEEKRLIAGFSSSNLFAQPSQEYRKWCLRAFTDRNSTNAKKLTDVSSWVEFSWYRLDHLESKRGRFVPIPCVHGNPNEDATNASFHVPRCRDVRPSCTIAYDGFRGEYRLSPDFGGYQECQQTISGYFHRLSNKTDRNRLVVSKENFLIPSKQRYDVPLKWGCPLKRLPFSSDDLEMCTLSTSAWYLLEFRSYARWINENGTLIEAIGNNGDDRMKLFRTYDRLDDIYVTHTQVKGCLLKTVFLLRHKLPFSLTISIDIHVKNNENDVKQIQKEDRHEVTLDLVGKEFTYKLPGGSRVVRYCQKIEANLDPDFRLILPAAEETQACLARAVTHCPKEETNSEASKLVVRAWVTFYTVLSFWSGIRMQLME